MNDNELVRVDFKSKTVLSRHDATKPLDPYVATKDDTFKKHIKGLAIACDTLHKQTGCRPTKLITMVIDELTGEPYAVAVYGDTVMVDDLEYAAGCLAGVAEQVAGEQK